MQRECPKRFGDGWPGLVGLVVGLAADRDYGCGDDDGGDVEVAVGREPGRLLVVPGVGSAVGSVSLLVVVLECC